MAKKKEEQVIKETKQDIDNNKDIKIKQDNKIKTCARCGAEIVSGKQECPVCLAPITWKA